MKLSEAIKELEEAIIEHGDVELHCLDDYGEGLVVKSLYFGRCAEGGYCLFQE